MKYNYVIFNGYDGPEKSSYNEDGYYSICMRDLWAMDNVLISNMPLDYSNNTMQLVYRLLRRLHFPLRWLYPYFLKLSFKENKPLCFVIIGYEWPMDYYQWLKEKYPTGKFVRFTRDLISTQQNFINSLIATDVVDYWITYDENEAKKYDMLYHPEVESKIDLPKNKELKYDVFFAGRAKKRLSKIVEVYDALEKAGLNCFFYIMGAKPEEQQPRKGIVYTDKYLSYRQMLEYDMQSKCLLEINQEGAVGYTSRFIEAVMYNKLLLTDNISIKQTSYYDSRYMQCIDNVNDINATFIKQERNVDYHYDDSFSPRHFINYLEALMS